MLRLWPRPQACAQARHAIRDFCVDHSLLKVIDDAELLTSELVSNAIEHSGTLVTFVALCREGELIVNVRDDVAGAGPRVVELDDPMADGGRGLYILRELASTWGITDHRDGKSVWFRLP